MKRISRSKVCGGGAVLAAVIAVIRATRVGSSMDCYLAHWERVGAEVRAVKMEDQADLDKKYAIEVNEQLVKLVGTVRVTGFSVKAVSKARSVAVDGAMTLGRADRILKLDDERVSLLVTMGPLFGAWAKTVVLGSSRQMLLPLSSITSRFIRMCSLMMPQRFGLPNCK
ncbi:hypothetical protein KPB04_13570 [Burkholderia cenocepacia]|uniref:hypothetical protein n=1 Tax=Burkholderia cenocepacia TaxID=95486 RepID=UPI002855F68F|nr:hypothetical protein [Burkholderia cenocepacia]MDR8102760.1 hypothetical protein [Burkholderia cenocepacia]